jgi:hypothetical protein
MSKLLIAAAAAGLASIAIGAPVFAQDQPSQNASQGQTSVLSQLATSFADADTDKSGGISFTEATAVHPSLTQAQFNMVDQDKNGSLNEDEYAALDAAPRLGQEAN